MNKQDILLHIWLSGCFSYASVMPSTILKYYSGDINFFYENLETEITKFKITQKKLELLKQRNLDVAERILKLCKEKDIKITTYYSKTFPERLREIKTSPIVLYYKGNIKATFSPCVAVIGTRNCNQIGLENSRKITKELVKYGITTISGCAKGIDGSIHKNTINENGKTIAILGTPLDSNYPYEHVKLKQDIIKTDGLIISEYPPKTKTYAWHFPIRNRIISAMSDCVVVVQSKEKSGTILTAKKTLEYNKKLFCFPPSDIFDENSRAIKQCLKKGATLLIGIEDILKLYKNSKYKPKTIEKTKCSIEQKTKEKKEIPEKFKELIKIIGKEKRLEEILQQIDYKTKDTLIMLTQLELLNLVEKTNTGYRSISDNI